MYRYESKKGKIKMEQIAIIEAFAALPDARRCAGMRHKQTLCLALFTLAIAAGNKGFLAMGYWLKAYQEELLVMFKPYKNRLPSYSTIRRVMLKTDIEKYQGNRILIEWNKKKKCSVKMDYIKS
jgi:hypothetical protein